MNPSDKRIIFSIAGILLIFSNALSHFDLASTTIGSYGFIKEIITYLNNNTTAKFLLLTGTSIFGFVWFFMTILSIYSNPKIWNFFNRDISLNGNWVYLFKDEATQCTIFGKFIIEHTIDKIKIKKAICWYSGIKDNITQSNKRGTWESESISQEDGYCWVFYKMEIMNQFGNLNEQMYNGVMRMIVGDDNDLKTKVIDGSINDHGATIEHKGTMYAKRVLRKDKNLLDHLNDLPKLIEKYLDGKDVTATNTCAVNDTAL